MSELMLYSHKFIEQERFNSAPTEQNMQSATKSPDLASGVSD
jgi:hypothetical protein